MATRNQSVHQTAAAWPRKRRRSARLAAAKNAPLFLSLPVNTLNLVFDCLSANPGSTGTGSRDALNLAATCRALNEFYRCTYVVGFDVIGSERSLSTILVRALKRLPRVRTLELARIAWRRGSVLSSLVGGGRNRASLKQRALGIKSICLRDDSIRPLITAEVVRGVAETYRNLEHLDLSLLVVNWDDVALTIAENLSSTLRTLVFITCPSLSDAGGAHIGRLRCLKTLTMGCCHGLTDVTFSTLGSFVELEELDINSCNISDEAACGILSSLRKLRKLNLAGCHSVTDAIFSVLPRSLEELELCHSGAVTAGVPYSALERVPNLKSFGGSGQPRLNELSFLAPVAARLQTLRLSRSGLSDANAAHWVSEMPNLVRLYLSESDVADETARAVSSLRKIEKLELSWTLISNDGVRALTSGVACQSLKTVILWCCQNLTSQDDALSMLSREIAKNGGGKLFTESVEMI